MKLYRRKSKTSELEHKIKKTEEENNTLLDKTNTGGKQNEESQFLKLLIDFENIGYGIKSSDEEMVYLSDNAKKTLGIISDSEKIPLNDLSNLIVPEERQEFLNMLNDISNFQKPHSFEYKIIKPDQDREIRYISSKISYLKNLEKWIFTVTDVSKYEKVKKDLIRSKEKAEESDDIKNIFLSNISHEIRIPMNSIVGFAELINIGNISPETKDEYIRIIRHQSNQLLKLIDDISEITKFEAGEIKINKSPCNLSLLSNELHTYFKEQKKLLKKDHIELKLNNTDKKGIITYTDSGRLHQLLSNLLSNAIKFTEKGAIEFGYCEREGKIEFYVKDTGIGLTKEEQRHIFDRFKIREEILTRKYEGSGLGLTIARGIVKLLGGKIWIESEPGKGSVFYFNIPFEHLPKEERHIDDELTINEYNWRDKIILVVEDDDVNYKFIETLLTENQAKVLRADNGYQAIELCKSISKIDIILMDIKLPLMDGFEATRQIRLFNKTIPIIAQTAYAMDEDRAKCLQVGCNDQVSKPIDIEEILKKINSYFLP